MYDLFDLLSALVPTASAKLSGLGSQGPGVSEMWSSITELFPFTDEGANTPATIALSIIDFILKTIGLGAAAVLVWAGVRAVFSGGEGGLDEAKKMAKNAAIGLICAIIADAVVQYAYDKIVEAAGG